MMALIIGFLIPVVVWFLVLPLKLALRIVEKSAKYSIKVAVEAHDKLEESLDKNKGNSPKKDRTSKLARMSAKTAYVLAKFSILTLIKTLKLAIKVIEWLVRLASWVVGLIGGLYAVLIAGSIIAVVVVSVAVMNTDYSDTSDSSKDTSSESTTSFTDDFMSIDWSQDFTSQLNKIEDKNGLEARNWVEMKIIEMNTMKQSLENNDIEIGVSGFMTGIKAVESGQVSLASKPNMAMQEVKVPNAAFTDTPMQFDTNWQKYNPYYTEYDRPSEGSGYYYPDAFYGIANRFNKASVEGFRPERTTPLYESAFEDMGVNMTTDKLRFVRYITNLTNEYNAVFLENTSYIPGLTKADTNNTVYANAMLMIQFGETYGYGVNDNVIKLARAMYAKNLDDSSYSKWFFDKSKAMSALYGMGTGGGKNYPSDLDDSSDLGVIDGNGNAVKGSLFSFLVNEMPSKAKKAMLDSSGLKKFNGSRSHYARSRYDLTAFITGVYDLWWATDALGVQ